jgi:SAM-dependent MidA family methyltransferase
VTEWLTWRAATEAALYGRRGFYRRPEGPAGHFRTSVHVSDAFGAALLRLARAAELDTVLDVGAGRGELVRTLHRLDPSLRLHGVDLAARPDGLPDAIGWSAEIPAGLPALLIANEWLDNVPLDVAERTEDGVELVLVDPASGAERLGGPVPDADARWLAAWWPLAAAQPGDRAEIGRSRDEAWAAAVRALPAGLAVAVDYGHRRDARPAFGTLAGFREGRAVPPVPDGSCDVTAHVALDACDAAGRRAGATASVLTTQREALRALGISGARPPLDLARTAPAEYLRALAAASDAAELTARGGLGAHGWLVQAVRIPLPAVARSLVSDLDLQFAQAADDVPGLPLRLRQQPQAGGVPEQ